LPPHHARRVATLAVEFAELFVQFALLGGVAGGAGALEQRFGYRSGLGCAGGGATRDQLRKRAARLRGDASGSRGVVAVTRSFVLERRLQEQERACLFGGVLGGRFTPDAALATDTTWHHPLMQFA
jgi:hypothetical protein